MSSDRLFRPEHPFTCTCTKCVRKKLARLRRQEKSDPCFIGGNLMRKFSTAKLLLNLLVIACLVGINWTGYLLFIARQIDPVMGVIFFLGGVGILIWNILVLRSHHYRWKSPNFKLVFFPLLGIVLVLAFAGIQPLAGYKDTLITSVGKIMPSSSLTSIQVDHLEIPNGTYISDSEPKAHRIVFSKDRTLSTDSTYELRSIFQKTPGFPELGLRTYKYILMGYVPSKEMAGKFLSEVSSLDEVSQIELKDVVTGRTITLSCRYISEYKIIVLGGESYRK